MSYVNWTTQEPEFNPILKPYQMRILEILEASNHNPTSSKDIWYCTNQQGEKVSRASVINFLELLREEKIIVGTKATGKGGRRFNYRLHKEATIETVINQLAFRMIEQMQIANPKINFIWIAENLATLQEGGFAPDA